MARNVERVTDAGDAGNEVAATGFEFLARRPLSSLSRHARKGDELADAPLNGIEADLMENRSPYVGMGAVDMRAALDRQASERWREFEADNARLGPRLMT